MTFRDANARRVSKLPPDTTCYRLSDEDLPGITVDRFGPGVVLSLYRDAPEEQRLADELLALDGIESVYVKRRPREARKLANEAAAELAPAMPIAGVPNPAATIPNSSKQTHQNPRQLIRGASASRIAGLPFFHHRYRQGNWIVVAYPTSVEFSAAPVMRNGDPRRVAADTRHGGCFQPPALVECKHPGPPLQTSNAAPYMPIDQSGP